MPQFGRERYIYSLAGAWLAGAWEREALAAAVLPLSRTGIRTPKLVERVLAAFVARPGYGELVAWLWGDAKFAAAMERAEGRGVRPARSGFAGLRGLDIPKLETTQKVADWLGVESGMLGWWADVRGRNRRSPAGPLRTYRFRWVKKKSGGARLLEIPKFNLKCAQRRILREILSKVPLHEAVHGFVGGRSIVTNAGAHCGKEVVLRFDLADFFVSVTAVRVRRIFESIGYPRKVAQLLMGLCTTAMPADVWERRPAALDNGADFAARQRLISRHLPQGAPTSPALANLAAARLDRRLTGLAKKMGAAYTRYADDLTVSGGAETARAARRLEIAVAVIAAGEGFAVNHHKTRIMRKGARQQVTGVVVNAHPNVRRDAFDRLKAILTNCARHGPASQNRKGATDFRGVLRGNIAHVAAIHPKRGEKLIEIFSRIVWDDAGGGGVK